MNHSGRRIVVTGASRGLGQAMTRGFAGEGHTVWGCSRSADAVARLRDEFPSPHRFEMVDVTDASRVAEWAESLLADNDPPDLLVNNAAVINRNAPLWELDTDEFHQTIDVNINGVFHVIRAFVPAMVARGSGVIVNFSSGWGRSVSADVASYCATKFAIEGLTQAMAAELPSGMAAVPLNPGVIHTEMLESCFGTHASAYPDPETWAQRAVPFLLKLGPKDNGRPLTVPA
ncbi:MAG: SDR family oxidoreductase [Pirellulaceae bacterium]